MSDELHAFISAFDSSLRQQVVALHSKMETSERGMERLSIASQAAAVAGVRDALKAASRSMRQPPPPPPRTKDWSEFRR